MKQIVTLAAILVLLTFGLQLSGIDAQGQTPDPALEWVRQFGISASDGARAVGVDGSSNIYVVGSTFGTFAGQVSEDGVDSFVRKYDANRDEVWTRQFGTSTARAGAVDSSGNVYVLGSGIRKYDTNGNEVWTRQLGGEAVAVGGTGNVYVAGEIIGALPGQTSSGSADAFVRKYDKNGNEVWTRQFGSSSADEAFGVSVDSSGVYVAGYTFGALPDQTSAGVQDGFVRKYDANGNEVWTRQFGSSLADKAFGVSVDASGVYVAGHTHGAFPGQTSAGGQDGFVRKYDANGNEVWTRQFGSSSADEAFGVSVDASGVYVAGDTAGTLPGQTSAGGGDAFAAKLPLTGTMHVASIELSFLTERRKVEAVAQVLMVDEEGFPVPGATVTGDWFLNSKLFQEGTIGSTGSDGIATINSGRIKGVKSGDPIKFCVAGATDTHTYIQSANLETCDQITKP